MNAAVIRSTKTSFRQEAANMEGRIVFPLRHNEVRSGGTNILLLWGYRPSGQAVASWAGAYSSRD